MNIWNNKCTKQLNRDTNTHTHSKNSHYAYLILYDFNWKHLLLHLNPYSICSLPLYFYTRISLSLSLPIYLLDSSAYKCIFNFRDTRLTMHTYTDTHTSSMFEFMSASIFIPFYLLLFGSLFSVQPFRWYALHAPVCCCYHTFSGEFSR